MAKEKFVVIFAQANSGAGVQIPFKNQTEAQGGETVTETARVATLEAGSSQEAATAVRRAYGESVITGKVKVVKASQVEEKSA